MKKNELSEELNTSRMYFSNLKNKLQKYINIIFDESKSMIKDDDNFIVKVENKTNYEVNFNEQGKSLSTGSLFYPKAERTNINLINSFLNYLASLYTLKSWRKLLAICSKVHS
jgi:hypothetical protein